MEHAGQEGFHAATGDQNVACGPLHLGGGLRQMTKVDAETKMRPREPTCMEQAGQEGFHAATGDQNVCGRGS